MPRVSSSGSAETLNFRESFTSTQRLKRVLSNSKSNRKCFQVHVPLPLPKHLVIFGLGEWKSSDIDATISVDVVVSAELPAQRIGTLSTHARCVEDVLKKKKKNTAESAAFLLPHAFETQVPDLGGRMEQRCDHSGSRERPERGVWQDCADCVW